MSEVESSAQKIFAAIQKLPPVQIQGILFAACTHHSDIAERVFEAVLENEEDNANENGDDETDPDEKDSSKLARSSKSSVLKNSGRAKKKINSTKSRSQT